MTANLTNIFLCGDPHGDFSFVIAAVLKYRPDAIVLLGDLMPDHPLSEVLKPILDMTEVWLIHGNHDVHRAHFAHVFEDPLMARNLHGRVATVAGLRIAGLGGIFTAKSEVWESPEHYLRHCPKSNRLNDGLPRNMRATIFPSEVAALSQQKADILVTHEGPHWHPFGKRKISDMAASMDLTAAFHGHLHLDIHYPNTVWHGVGERGIMALDGTIIRPGDPQQAARPHLPSARPTLCHPRR